MNFANNMLLHEKNKIRKKVAKDKDFKPWLTEFRKQEPVLCSIMIDEEIYKEYYERHN